MVVIASVEWKKKKRNLRQKKLSPAKRTKNLT